MASTDFAAACIAGALLAACAAGASVAQEFNHRGWAGARLPGDRENGCAMALEVQRDAGLVVYADSKRRVRIGLASRAWKLEPGKEALAAVTFNDGPPILLKGEAVLPTTVLFDPMDFPDDGGLGALVEGARSVKLTYDGLYVRARLSGSARAMRLLRECASAPPEAAPPPEASDGGAGRESVGRSADFAFLRQGMDALEAHRKLIEAGWQADGDAPAAPADDGALKVLRERGLPAASCSGETCAATYADAYGNALRTTLGAEGEPKLRGWRLNPPDEAREATKSED